MNIDFIVYGVLIYLACIWAITIVVTILDKYLAVNHKWRISEKALITLGILGGALPEYAVMKMIRHKTLHKKFMIGLPVITIFHVMIIVIAELFVHGIINF